MQGRDVPKSELQQKASRAAATKVVAFEKLYPIFEQLTAACEHPGEESGLMLALADINAICVLFTSHQLHEPPSRHLEELHILSKRALALAHAQASGRDN